MTPSLDRLSKLTQELAVAEQARLQLQMEFDTLFNLCPDLLCIATTDGWFKRVNPSFERILGWSVDVFLSRPFAEFVHEDDRPETNAELVKLMTDGYETKDFCNRYLCSSGVFQWIEWRAAKDNHGLIYACGRAINEKRLPDDLVTK